MKHLRILLLTLLLPTALGVGACGGRSLGRPDGGDGGPRVDGDASNDTAADASGTDGGTAETVACDDGTGATNCCPASAIVDTACSAEGLTCRTACMPTLNGGYQTQKFCKDGRWIGGLGLIPCSCLPGADQTCNDDPIVSSLWGHCEATGVCTCKTGRSLNPATGRCRLDPGDAAASN
jgi:hypothetical protein